MKDDNLLGKLSSLVFSLHLVAFLKSRSPDISWTYLRPTTMEEFSHIIITNDKVVSQMGRSGVRYKVKDEATASCTHPRTASNLTPTAFETRSLTRGSPTSLRVATGPKLEGAVSETIQPLDGLLAAQWVKLTPFFSESLRLLTIPMKINLSHPFFPTDGTDIPQSPDTALPLPSRYLDDMASSTNFIIMTSVQWFCKPFPFITAESKLYHRNLKWRALPVGHMIVLSRYET